MKYTIKITIEEGNDEWWETLEGKSDMEKCAAVADGVMYELNYYTGWEVVSAEPAMVERANVKRKQ